MKGKIVIVILFGIQNREHRIFRLHYNSGSLKHEGGCAETVSWLYFQGSVYLGSTTEQTWQESRQYCQKRGADLTIISSVQEQTFVATSFTERRWIGLTASQSREWIWVDGSQLNTRFTQFWDSGEPNNKHNDEFCVETNYNGDTWNDEGCYEKRLSCSSTRVSISACDTKTP
uniref:C-type lectin domain-containing protein n=1 Tax=Periophthalmus magnuspinnatus TaxID=409849 RepID=A0A3B4BLW8_9GOBI